MASVAWVVIFVGFPGATYLSEWAEYVHTHTQY